MLHDLPSFIEAEDVHPGIVAVPRPVLVAVQDHEVAFGLDEDEAEGGDGDGDEDWNESY